MYDVDFQDYCFKRANDLNELVANNVCSLSKLACLASELIHDCQTEAFNGSPDLLKNAAIGLRQVAKEMQFNSLDIEKLATAIAQSDYAQPGYKPSSN
jgi:hypothetical protein